MENKKYEIMKRINLIYIIIAAFMLCSCIHDNNGIIENNKECGLTIKEAKDFWENQVFTRSMLNGTKSLNPGSYIPFWDSAIFSHNDTIVNVDVPISVENNYKILHSDFVHREAQIRKVDVVQKIVITKNINSGKINQYRMALIPNLNKNTQFISLGDKKMYSGWAIYFLPFMKSPFKIEKYQIGRKVLSIVIPREKGEKPLSSSTLNKILGYMQIMKCHSVSTRSTEDYDNFWDWFEQEIFAGADDGDSFTIEQEGDSWSLEDQDGNRYKVPDGLINNDDVEVDDSSNSGSSPDDGNESEEIPETDFGSNDELVVWLQIYHKSCNTYLGEVDASSPGNSTFYCSRCKVYVPVYW